MNKEIPLIPALVFLVLIFNAIYLYTSRVESLSPISIQQISADRDGNVWGLFGDRLIDLSDTQPSRSFSPHGFDNHVGQVVPLSTGEWLLNFGAQGNYLASGIARTVRKADSEYQASSSLLRCSADLLQCEPWGEAELQFERGFEGLELSNSSLLLFKAEQGRIFFVSENGIILNQIKNEEMWFGANQVSANEWLGLNTAYQQLIGFKLSDDELSLTEVSVDLKNLNGEIKKIINPSKVVVHEGHLWLLGFFPDKEGADKLELAERLVNQTKSLVSIDLITKVAKRLPYDLTADAELELLDNSIYFTEFGKHEIKRFDLVGETMQLVESDNMLAAYREDSERLTVEKKEFYKLLGINALFGIGAFIWLLTGLKSPKLDRVDDETIGDSVAYYQDKTGFEREFSYVAKVFAKKELSKAELAAIQLFRKIDGDYVYYPNGLYSTGKLVSDENRLIELFKWGEQRYEATLVWVLLPWLGLVFGAAIFAVSSGVGLLILGVALISIVIGLVKLTIQGIRRRKILKTMISHDSRLKFSDTLALSTRAMPKRAGEILIGLGVVLILVLAIIAGFSADNFSMVTSLAFTVVPMSVIFVISGLYIRRAKSQ